MAEDESMAPQVDLPDELPGAEADIADNMDDDLDYVDKPGKEVNVTPDGGVIKKIITVGDGWEMPEKGDEVTVHYVGTLEDGSKFDSSRDRDDPFVFQLGEGRVIKGWDLGVATMKKGEKSLLICKSDYAYGASGSPPKIPGGATLHFEVELLSWKSVKDLAGDGGVIKTVLADGSGWDTCKDPYEAVVSYKAKVAGSDTWFADVEEAVFPVSEGHLVPGLAVALRTMKKGDKVHLKLKPQYGFGEAGSEQYGVPANAELELELELKNWYQVEDVTDDGKVVKKTLQSNEDEYKRPNAGATVTVRLTGRLLPGDPKAAEPGPVFEQHLEGDELTFVTCEEQVVEGLDEAVMKMKKGERALVTIKDGSVYGYGAAGKEAGPLGVAVPPNAALQYDVELVSFENAKESWEMSDGEKVEAAKALKEKGNARFKAGKLAKAVVLWDKAVALVQYDKTFTDAVLAGAREVKRSAWLNLAAVAIKQERWKDAEKQCNSVLEHEPHNVKALYRRAQAHIGTADLLDAEQDLKRAAEAEPDNADVAALTKKLKLLIRAQNKKEASLYSKMFKPSPAAAAAPGAQAVAQEQPAAAAEEAATVPEAPAPSVEVEAK